MEASLQNSFLPESPEELKISMDDGIKSPNSKMNSISCESSPKRSRKSLQKRIISVPIAEADGSRLKGDGAPPSDSWAWRKYGQKPIKGSPYPRGYYRCSSSKGCPARKQVERSRLDPRMLVITYASDHNHPWPISKHPSTIRAANNLPTFNPLPEDLPVPHDSSEVDPEDNKFAAGLVCEDFSWLADFPSSLSNRDSVLCNPISNIEEQKFNEDESFFADLGELPECSAVFQWGFYQQQVKSGLTATPVCSGTT